MAREGRPIRMYIKLDGGSAGADLGSKILVPLESAFNQLTQRLNARMAAAVRIFSSGFDSAFGKFGERISGLEGKLDRLIRRLGTVAKALQGVSGGNIFNIAGLGGGGMGGGGGGSSAEKLLRDQERLASKLRAARNKGQGSYESDYQSSVLAANQQQFDALKAAADEQGRAILERAESWSRQLQEAEEEKGRAIVERAHGWSRQLESADDERGRAILERAKGWAKQQAEEEAEKGRAILDRAVGWAKQLEEAENARGRAILDRAKGWAKEFAEAETERGQAVLERAHGWAKQLEEAEAERGRAILERAQGWAKQLEAAEDERGREILARAEYWSHRLVEEAAAAARARAVAAGNATSGRYVGQGGILSAGFNRTGTSYNGPGNDPSSISYQRPAGLFRSAERVTRDLASGTMSREVQDGTSLWSRFVTKITGDGSLISKSLNVAFLPLRAVHSMFGKIGDVIGTVGHKLVYLSALFYSMERVGRGFRAVVVDPVKDILQQTEASRAFEASIAGVVGGLGRAREINDGLVRSVQKLPFTMEELRDVAREFTILPSQAASVARGSIEQATSEFESFGRLAAKLGILDPQQGVKGSLVAIREGLAGEFRSLRLRLEIQPERIASAAGATVQDLQRDPNLFLKGLTKYTNAYVGDEAVDRLGNLFSKRVEKFYDTIRAAAEKIGNSGLFDDVNRMLMRGAESIFAWVDSPEFKGQASRISSALTNILKNVGQAGVNFLRGLTGNTDATGGVADTVAGFAETMSSLSNRLPALGQSVGEGLRGVSDAVSKAIEKIGQVANALIEINEHPEELVKRGVRNMTTGTDVPGSNDAVEMPFGPSVPVWRPKPGTVVDQPWGPSVPIANVRYPADTPTGPEPSDVPFDLKTARLAELDAQIEATQRFIAHKNARGSTAGMDSLTDRLYGLLNERSTWGGVRGAKDIMGAISPVIGAAATPGLGVLGDLLRRLSGRSDNTDVFTNEVLGGFGNVGEIYDATTDPMLKYASSEQRALAALRGGGTSLSSRLQVGRDRQLSELSGMREQYGTLPFAGRILDYLEESVKKSFDAKLALLPGQLEDNVRAFGLGLAQRLESASPQVAAEMLSDITKGTTELGNVAAKGLQSLELGFNRYKASSFGGTFYEGRKVSLQRYAAEQSSIEQATRLGLIPGGTPSAAMLEHLRPLGDRERDRLLLASARNQQSKAVIGYAGAQFDYAAKLADGTATNLDRQGVLDAKRDLAEVSARVRELELATNDAAQAFIEFGSSVRDSLQNSLGKGIGDLIKGTGTLRDVLTGFANDVIDAFSKMAARNLMQSVFGDFLMPQSNGMSGGIGGILGSILSGVGGRAIGGAGASDAAWNNFVAGGSGTPSAWSIAPAANGAVWPGFTPIRAFAGGGIVSRPTLGLIGERPDRMPEAVVPMPGGRGIPVAWTGGGGGGRSQEINIHNIVVKDQAEATAEAARIRALGPDDVVNIIAKDFGSMGPAARAARHSLAR